MLQRVRKFSLETITKEFNKEFNKDYNIDYCIILRSTNHGHTFRLNNIEQLWRKFLRENHKTREEIL